MRYWPQIWRCEIRARRRAHNWRGVERRGGAWPEVARRGEKRPEAGRLQRLRKRLTATPDSEAQSLVLGNLLLAPKAALCRLGLSLSLAFSLIHSRRAPILAPDLGEHKATSERALRRAARRSLLSPSSPFRPLLLSSSPPARSRPETRPRKFPHSVLIPLRSSRQLLVLVAESERKTSESGGFSPADKWRGNVRYFTLFTLTG